MKVITSDSSILTMSSLEMVSYINSTRKPGEAELRHDHFMDKVPKVLGEVAKFSGDAFYMVNNAKRERKIYNFPRREAMLMATSYGYSVQLGVMSSWDAAEDLIANEEFPQSLPDFGYSPKLSTPVSNMDKTYDNLCDDIKGMTKVEMGVIIAALAQHVREACKDAGHTFKGLDNKITAVMLLSAMQDYKKLSYMSALRIEAERSTYKGMTMGGQVYVIKFEDGHIKIGKSWVAESRIKCIAGSNQSRVLDYWISDRVAGYHEVERLAHIEFSDDRKGGEFFTTDYATAIDFVRLHVSSILINEISLVSA